MPFGRLPVLQLPQGGKKPEDIRASEERRAGVIDAMMSDARHEAEKAERERRPEKEAAPEK